MRKSLKWQKVLFHRAHNCVCCSCHRVSRLSGVQVVLISDSINWWKRKRYSFCLWCPALQFDESRDQQGKSHHNTYLGPSFPTQSPRTETCTDEGCADLDCGVKQHFCIIPKCLKFKNWNKVCVVQTNIKEHCKRMT